MKVRSSAHRPPLACRLIVAAITTVCGTCATLWAEPVWQKNIADAFQHQRWGAKPGNQPQPFNPIAGANDPGGDTLEQLNLGGGRTQLFSWQVNGTINPPNQKPALGSFQGWCIIASWVDQFYHFKNLPTPFNVMGNVANADDLHNEVRALARDLFLQGGVMGSTKELNKVLAARNIDPTKVRAGLTAQNYKQGSDNVKFMSSTGVEKNLPKPTIFDHLQTAFESGDTASLRLSYNGAPGQNDPQQALWWRGEPLDNAGKETGNSHTVAVAGFDTAGDGTIWFADPDSNPTGNGATGNKNSDAGWYRALSWSPETSNDWLAAPAAAVPVKQRRFAAGAAVPKPAGDAPTQAEQDKLYFKGTLAANKTEFAIADADYKRYDTVKIRYLETIEVVKGGGKPRLPGGLAAETLTFQVSPGQPNTGPDAISGIINEIFVFPASYLEQFTGISDVRVNGIPVPWAVVPDRDLLQPGVWNIYFFGQNSADRWGNSLRWGGVSMRAGLGVAALAGTDLLEFDYSTQGAGELTAWDFMYNDSTDVTLSSLGVQVLGGGYDLPYLQGPEPSDPPSPVPTVSIWGALAMIFLLATAGTMMLRRQMTADHS